MDIELSLDEDWGASSARNSLQERERAIRYPKDKVVKTWLASMDEQRVQMSMGVLDATLPMADVWAVAPTICRMVYAEADKMPEPPDRIIHSINVPHPFGYVQLGYGLADRAEPSLNPMSREEIEDMRKYMSMRDDVLLYHAISWAMVQAKDNDSSDLDTMLMVYPWAWLTSFEQPRIPKPMPAMPISFPLDVRFDKVGWVSPDDGVNEKKLYPVLDGEFPPWNSSYNWIIRVMLSLWSWATDEVASERVPLGRTQIKQEARQGRSTTDVNVIKLRRCERSERTGEGDSVHGGTVSPHVRRSHPAWQPHGPGNSLRKLIRRRSSVVNAHLLGDDDPQPEPKPRIFNVDR